VIHLGGYFDQILNAGIDPQSVDAAELRRIKFFYAYIFIGIFACGGSALVLLISQPTGFSYIALIITLTILVVLGLVLRFLKRTDVVVQLLLSFFFALAWFILIQSETTTGIFWLYVYAPISALLLRRWIALFWIIAFAIWIAFLVTFSWLGTTTYEEVQVYAFVATFLPISLFMVAYRRITEKAEREVYEKDIQLKELTQKLEAELAFASRSKQQLDGLSVALSKQNKKLTSSKSALLNLLEDARQLEGELKRSKANVEKQVESRTRELSLERARLASTLESLPIAVVLIDKNGKVADANDKAYELVGVPEAHHASRVAHRKISTFIDKKLQLMKFIQQCSNSTACVMIPELTYKDEFYKVALGPVESQDSDTNGGVVVVIENITAQKLLDRSKDEFLMIASHELRTPLTAIRGDAAVLSKYIEKDMNKKDAQELVQDIRGSSDRLLGVVNDYLELSSLEQGKIPFNLQRLDMIALCQQVIDENRPLANEKKLKLIYKKPHNRTLCAQADPTRVAQVIQNLLSNAIHYTQKGTISLELSASEEKITCRVKDTGVGISKFSQKNLFDKFNQAQDNLLTRDPERSTGLGLYIAKLLIEKMHGHLVLESSVLKKGSVFAFSLPVYRNETKKKPT